MKKALWWGIVICSIPFCVWGMLSIPMCLTHDGPLNFDGAGPTICGVVFGFIGALFIFVVLFSLAGQLFKKHLTTKRYKGIKFIWRKAENRLWECQTTTAVSKTDMIDKMREAKGIESADSKGGYGFRIKFAPAFETAVLKDRVMRIVAGEAT